MLKKALCQKIENAAMFIKETNQFFIAADKGQVNHNPIQYFLNSLAYIVPYTVLCLK